MGTSIRSDPAARVIRKCRMSSLLDAADAIALLECCDLDAVRDADELPRQLRKLRDVFTSDEWDELIAAVRSTREGAEIQLRKPQWAHLRRAPRYLVA